MLARHTVQALRPGRLASDEDGLERWEGSRAPVGFGAEAGQEREEDGVFEHESPKSDEATPKGASPWVRIPAAGLATFLAYQLTLFFVRNSYAEAGRRGFPLFLLVPMGLAVGLVWGLPQFFLAARPARFLGWSILGGTVAIVLLGSVGLFDYVR
jgi:hypothetical protein